MVKNSIDIINDNTIRQFLALDGEAYLNTLDGGGGYNFLLNKAAYHPILIINVLNFKSQINVKLIIGREELNFYCNSIHELIDKFKLKTIYINHLIWANDFTEIFDEIISTCKFIDLIIYIHDFFTFCPTINLLNFNGQYCGVPSHLECTNCINRYADSPNATKFASKQMKIYNNELNGEIRNWRILWQKIFNQARYIIFPSYSTAEIFSRAYGNQYQEKILIKPHNVSDVNQIKPKNQIAKNSFMNVYLLGYIDEHKGSRILKSLIDKTAALNLNICYHILGWFEYPEYEHSPFLKLYGTYKSEELAGILNKSEIDMFIQPSICPETFSYVVHEMKATGLPILAFNLGAQAEFLANYKPAILVNEISTESLFNEIRHLYDIHLKNLYPLLYTDIPNTKVMEFIQLLQERNLKVATQNCLTMREYKVQVDQQIGDIAVKNQIIGALLNSRSMRLTKPLREFGQILRRVRNKIKNFAKF